MDFNMFYCGDQLWDGQPWLRQTGSDPGGIAIMEKKANIMPVYIEKVYCGAANILKQEMLSLGGEVAVSKYAVNCKEQYGDVLIMGTYSQYKKLVKKLAAQHWKLKELGRELGITIRNFLWATKEEPVPLNGLGELTPSIFTPSGIITDDLREIQLVEINSNETTLQIKDFNWEVGLLRQYIYALQSKGYRVLIKKGKMDEALIVNFLRPNYYLC